MIDAIRHGDKAALARALADVEQYPDRASTLELLDAAFAAPRAHVIGLTGPPGVGKSTLAGALIATLRAGGRSVGVIAVDPSSKASGGALLGDRTRLLTDPEDDGVFVRSMAARDRLGGLASLSVAAMVLMRAAFDVVLLETVGVGQSETDIVAVADSVVLCIQPGSGDSLQFMKAGIIEIPHLLVVTKADLGAPALRARADVEGVLGLAAAADPRWTPPVVLVSATDGTGVDALLRAADAHFIHLDATGGLGQRRRDQARAWLVDAVRERFGRDGLARAGELGISGQDGPFRVLAGVIDRLGAGAA